MHQNCRKMQHIRIRVELPIIADSHIFPLHPIDSIQAGLVEDSHPCRLMASKVVSRNRGNEKRESTMNDPHVVALIYNVDHGKAVIYDEAEPLVVEEKAFRLKVKDKKASFYLKYHYATEAEARKAIDEYIRNWEFDGCLQGGPDCISLEFESADIKDRDPPPPPPPPPGIKNIGATFVRSGGTVSVAVSKGVTNYPSPPTDVSVTPDVQTMYDRYMGHRRGHEPLTGMAYFCFTFLNYLGEMGLNNGTKGVGAAAGYFQIGRKVLTTVSELSSTKGGRLEARKHMGVGQDLTIEERRFLKEAVKKIIRRVAEKAHAPEKDLTKITLLDLPRCE